MHTLLLNISFNLLIPSRILLMSYEKQVTLLMHNAQSQQKGKDLPNYPKNDQSMMGSNEYASAEIRTNIKTFLLLERTICNHRIVTDYQLRSS